MNAAMRLGSAVVLALGVGISIGWAFFHGPRPSESEPDAAQLAALRESRIKLESLRQQRVASWDDITALRQVLAPIPGSESLLLEVTRDINEGRLQLPELTASP
jgi:hypothetical protein